MGSKYKQFALLKLLVPGYLLPKTFISKEIIY